MTKDTFPSATADREIVTTRILNAPRKLVFEVWTNPKHVAQWWGPSGFTNTVHEMNVKPHGKWRLTMHGPDGTDYPNEITYKEVVVPSRLVFEHGTGEPDDPYQFETTVTFTERGSQTELTMRGVWKTKGAKDFVVENYGALEGNKQTLDRLEAYLSSVKF